MSKSSILLVPGSFTPGHVYANVVERVAAKGYDIRALQMPSVRLETESPTARKPPSMYEDASFIANQVSVLADEGRDVTIVAHSYGGVPATECVKGLAKVARQKLGKQGGVVRLAYMTALVPALGYSGSDVLEMGDRSEEGRMTSKQFLDTIPTPLRSNSSVDSTFRGLTSLQILRQAVASPEPIRSYIYMELRPWCIDS